MKVALSVSGCVNYRFCVDFLAQWLIDGVLDKPIKRLKLWRGNRRMSFEIQTPTATLAWAVVGRYLPEALERLQPAPSPTRR